MKRRVLTILILSGAVLVIAVLAWFIVSNTKDSTSLETKTYQSLSQSVNLPLYMPKNSATYKFESASAQDESIVISTYTTDKGVINVTQQPRPVVDPYNEKVKPADSYITSVGNARLFPDVKGEPYVVVQTEKTWVIVRSTDQKILSKDLKAFCLALTEVKASN